MPLAKGAYQILFSSQRRRIGLAAAVIALIWLGALAGVSFLSTPAKFAVTDLSLPVALQVGQVTFAAFARVEWVFALALLAACGWAWRIAPWRLGLAVLIAAGVLARALWLLPALSGRVAMIVAGESPPSAPHHAIYAAIEGVKALALTALAFLALRALPP